MSQLYEQFFRDILTSFSLKRYTRRGSILVTTTYILNSIFLCQSVIGLCIYFCTTFVSVILIVDEQLFMNLMPFELAPVFGLSAQILFSSFSHVAINALY